MNTLTAIVSTIFLLAFGSVLLKEGLQVDSAKEKMLKVNARPSSRRYPKFYIAVVGAISIIIALSFAFRFF